MGIPVIVYGKSGSGKSRSLKNFAEDEILHVNVESKRLPFRGAFKYTFNSFDSNAIVDQLQKMGGHGVKTAVIDDAGYLQTEYFMKNHRVKKGNASFDMYDAMADSIHNLFAAVKLLPEDAIVYIIFHEDVNDNGDIGIKTIGRLLDRKVCVEGMTTIVLRCMSDKTGKHFFKTVTDGADITKTPEDMFQDTEIPNDLKFVDTTIREYYNLGGK